MMKWKGSGKKQSGIIEASAQYLPGGIGQNEEKPQQRP
jgi:hypothetical protein